MERDSYFLQFLFQRNFGMGEGQRRSASNLLTKIELVENKGMHFS